jgi:hypothetical protein
MTKEWTAPHQSIFDLIDDQAVCPCCQQPLPRPDKPEEDDG